MTKLNRRRFLSIVTQSSGLLAISVWLPAEVLGNNKGRPASAPASSFHGLFVSIHADNRIVYNLSKQEMGQGISTGYAMIFADELGADLERMDVVSADYNSAFALPLQGITGGSSSMPNAWQSLREAAAEVRMRLILAAGRYWKDSPRDYTTRDSHVVDATSDRRVAFGELISYLSTEEKIVSQLRPASDYKYIGKSLPNIRVGEIVSGRLRYGMDVALPGMLYASIERCPVFLGKASDVDDSAARLVSGVVDVFKIDGFRRDAASEGMCPPYLYTVQDGVAVIATNSWAAMQGRKSLKIGWEGGKHSAASDQSVVAALSTSERKDGRTILQAEQERAPQPGDKSIHASYDITFQAHALMEPLNTVCHVTADACEVWSGHQFPRRIVEQLAPILSIAPERFVIHVLPSGGGFGRRWEADFVVEAALLSKHTGRPVKCVWSREDEIRHDYYHAYERHVDDVTLDAGGSVVAWRSKRITFNNVFLEDTWNPYMDGIPSRSLSLVELEAPLQTGPWRSVNPHRNTFSRECTVDRIATALGKDPLEFRLAWLKQDPIVPPGEANAVEWLRRAREERHPLISVLERAKALWPENRKGVGLAITTMSSTCAHIAHVRMVNGVPKLSKVDVVVYCGTAINPSLVKGQFEGSVIWALQAVLYGGVHMKNGRVVQSNFHDYKMVRMPEVPEIIVHLIESTDPPRGTGEPGVPPLAPAMANAIYSLTGKQPASIPFNWIAT